MEVAKESRYTLTLTQQEVDKLVDETNSIAVLHAVHPTLFELYMELLKHHSSN